MQAKNNLKTVVREKGLSIYRLAKTLELPQQTVYSWAWNKTQPTYNNLVKLLRVLDCDFEDLYAVGRG